MKLSVILSFVLFIWSGISGCASKMATIETGDVIFDCYHVNFAWGYHLSGVYIDSNGQAYRYNRNGNPWLPESVRRGSPVQPEAELMEKYMNRALIGKIDKEDLEEKIKLIGPASLGNLSRKDTAADAGGHGCVAYTYNRTNKTYTKIELGSVGDVTTTNSAQEAQELRKWLQAYWNLEKEKK